MMSDQKIEVRVGEWYKIKARYNDSSFASFDQPEKIKSIGKGFFRIQESLITFSGHENQKYTTKNYYFYPLPKKECEERVRLFREADEIRETNAKKINQIVKKLEKIDKNQQLVHWDNKYASSKYLNSVDDD